MKTMLLWPSRYDFWSLLENSPSWGNLDEIYFQIY